MKKSFVFAIFVLGFGFQAKAITLSCSGDQRIDYPRAGVYLQDNSADIRASDHGPFAQDLKCTYPSDHEVQCDGSYDYDFQFGHAGDVAFAKKTPLSAYFFHDEDGKWIVWFNLPEVWGGINRGYYCQ